MRCPECGDTHVTMTPRTIFEVALATQALHFGLEETLTIVPRRCLNCGYSWTTADERQEVAL